MIITFKTEVLGNQPGLQDDYKNIERVIDAREKPVLTLDFKMIEYATSATLSGMVQIGNKIRKKDGEFKIINVQAPLFKTFRFVNLDRVATIEVLPEEEIIVEIEEPAEGENASKS